MPWPLHAPLPDLYAPLLVPHQKLHSPGLLCCQMLILQSSWTGIFQVSQAWFTSRFAVFQPEHLGFYSERLEQCRSHPLGVLPKFLPLPRDMNNIYFLLRSQQQRQVRFYQSHSEKAIRLQRNERQAPGWSMGDLKAATLDVLLPAGMTSGFPRAL